MIGKLQALVAGGLGGAALLCGMAATPARSQSVSVTTYHNDTLRTGWNPGETSLNVASVAGGRFGLQYSVPLDDQVDAQPLVVANQPIAGRGVFTVAYVVTENNTVYAIDTSTGAILLTRNLGVPVPSSARSNKCPDNGTTIGIESTPVISTAGDALYVMANTYENGASVFRLHSLRLEDLADNVPSSVVRSHHVLSDGSIVAFRALSGRQRAALLLSGSTVYAAFAGYCDKAPGSRGWILGWNAQTLAPLANAALTNQQAAAPHDMFLSSVWMSGYGPATTGPGQPILMVTGNSDRSGTTFDPTYNLAESVIQVSDDLSAARALFTPLNEVRLDQRDGDFGSGGAMLLPRQPGLTPDLAVAAGKDGRLYLLNTDQPGAAPLGTRKIGPCFCGASYYTGADGAGRVVASGGQEATILRVRNYASKPSNLILDRQVAITSGQEQSFFTSISSNGTQSGSAVIWAVGRPVDADPANVVLYAIDPVAGSVIYSAVAGTWPNVGANANIVPTVANGQVLVATNGELAVFGLGNPQTKANRAVMAAARQRALARRTPGPRLAANEHAVYGTVLGVTGSVVRLQKRNGAVLLVDTGAIGAGSEPDLETGRAVQAVGTYAADGVMTARGVFRAKRSPALWLPDR